MLIPLVFQVIAATLFFLATFAKLYNVWFSKKWDPRTKHCFVTGGSRGTGLALAVLLAKRGAHVSIVAGDKEKLDQALAKLESSRQNAEQIFRAYSYAVDSEEESAAALNAAAKAHCGRCPDAVFLCAGALRPGYFIDQTEESLSDGLQMTLGAQAFTALAATKAMVRDGIKGKIVFVSSVLGLMSFVGYTSSSPGKFAIRGLAECLRSELKVYHIDVHVAFPPTISSPDLDEENEVRPEITRKIEETESYSPPEAVALAIVRGVERGSFHITMDFMGDVFRATAACGAPRFNIVSDLLYWFIGVVGLPIWRRSVDAHVMAHREEHHQYCVKKGYAS